jgi:O-antigen/teichoic acid export membrane protein
LFVRQGLGLLPLVGAVILANVFAVIIAWFLARRTVKLVFRLNKAFIKKLIRESLPMGTVLLVFTIDNKIDTVMLGSIKGSGAVGIYAVAYRVYDVLILGAAYLMNSLLPVLSCYGDLDQWGTKLRRIYQKAFDVLLLMGGSVFLATWFLAPLVVQLITQQRFFEFLDAVSVLRILSLALFLAYFNHLTGYTIVALGRQRPYLFIALSALIFNVLTNLLVIPKFSYYGAAMVTILTEGLVLLITTFFIFRLIKILPSPVHFPKTIIQLIKLAKREKGRS